MDKLVIVGSGASGVHFALSVLKKGYEVVMLDVGYENPEPVNVNPEDTFNDLKKNMNDPISYFLGENYESVIYPDEKSEYYGIPPSKKFVFLKPAGFDFRSKGFAPLFSFARGGLAEAWTGGVYPFNDHELSDFPFNYRKIGPYYSEVADRIGIVGVQDDLAGLYPFHENILEPISLDQHSRLLLDAYEGHKEYLNHNLKCYVGRSRISVLSRDRNERKGCSYTGRCLWGCPKQSLYVPSLTLNECRKYSNFTYIPNTYITHFMFDSKRHIRSVVGHSTNDGKPLEFPVDRLILAAGTLSSSKIFIDSIYKSTGEIIRLHGLMDNRQILVPFLNLRMIGKSFKPETYQYHQIVLNIEGDHPEENIHGQITTLKTSLIHPIIQNLPLDLKTSIFMFRNIHAALGVVNVNLHDRRREENFVTIEVNQGTDNAKLVINYSAAYGEKALIDDSIKKVKKVLWKLGCIAPAKMIHIRPMGASVHYSGTIPMSFTKKEYTASQYCQSHDFDNLYFVDGTTLPFLPAKNLTFTLMANSVRVADCAF
jgi:choline dehydrogenase-like flavoprotein